MRMCPEEGCEFKAQTTEEMDEHVCSMKKCQFPNCPFRAAKQEDLDLHWVETHREPRIWRCTEPGCIYRTSEVMQYIEHKNHVHSKYTCANIGCTFKSDDITQILYHSSVHAETKAKESKMAKTHSFSFVNWQGKGVEVPWEEAHWPLVGEFINFGGRYYVVTGVAHDFTRENHHTVIIYLKWATAKKEEKETPDFAPFIDLASAALKKWVS